MCCAALALSRTCERLILCVGNLVLSGEANTTNSEEQIDKMFTFCLVTLAVVNVHGY